MTTKTVTKTITTQVNDMPSKTVRTVTTTTLKGKNGASTKKVTLALPAPKQTPIRRRRKTVTAKSKLTPAQRKTVRQKTRKRLKVRK